MSSAPADRILNAQAFHYTTSGDTDIRKTFARVRRQRTKAAAVVRSASNVRPLTIKTRETSPQAIKSHVTRR